MRSWKWVARRVDRNGEHLELRHGSANSATWEDWLPVAVVGPPSVREFPVQFLLDVKLESNRIALEGARHELDYYLGVRRALRRRRRRREPDDRGRTDTRAHAHLEEEALKETS